MLNKIAKEKTIYSKKTTLSDYPEEQIILAILANVPRTKILALFNTTSTSFSHYFLYRGLHVEDIRITFIKIGKASDSKQSHLVSKLLQKAYFPSLTQAAINKKYTSISIKLANNLKGMEFFNKVRLIGAICMTSTTQQAAKVSELAHPLFLQQLNNFNLDYTAIKDDYEQITTETKPSNNQAQSEQEIMQIETSKASPTFFNYSRLNYDWLEPNLLEQSQEIPAIVEMTTTAIDSQEAQYNETMEQPLEDDSESDWGYLKHVSNKSLSEYIGSKDNLFIFPFPEPEDFINPPSDCADANEDDWISELGFF